MSERTNPEPELLIALVNAAAGKEDEFNDWYTDNHLPAVVALPGFVQAQRYEVPSELAPQLPYRYATIYEIDGSSAEAVARLFGAGIGGSESIDIQNMVFSPFVPMGDPISSLGSPAAKPEAERGGADHVA